VQSPPAILLPNPIGHIQKGIKSLKINPLSRVTVFFPPAERLLLMILSGAGL
jgi:hypothetical protein